MQAVHGEAPSRLTHVDEQGRVRMVDVSEKEASSRFARASARLRMQAATLQLVRDGATKKGDVLATARLAGIQAAKRTWELIPLCHAIALSGVELELALDDTLPGIRVEARARTVERTGVEMEALVAVSVAGLTLYDMLKAVDRGMVLEQVQLEEKSGGRLGDFKRGS
ncbi:MAG TPA: cyclic pyranopterin monophosphate synthase MoaC [Polyangiaceae bacterium]|nr:cyclic pyranopterin monophosphate synthase MoaC [Polyangiaceae bacterium]